MSAQENQNPETPDTTGTPGTGAPTQEATTPPTQGPKKRGRKSNAERARLLEEQIASGKSAGASSGGAQQKKSSKSKTSFTQDQVSTLANQIVGVHLIVSKVTGLPEMMIAREEGEALAKSVTMVMEEYGFEISGKTGAAIQLFATAAMVYGPRVLAINARAKRAKPIDVQTHDNPDPAANSAG